jgi:hypothetical protein
VPSPDFLSLDTQGSEYDILEGAKNTLESNVLAVSLEVEFSQLYKGQKLYGEVSEFLRNSGFEMVQISRLFQMSPYRAPLGLRGEGFEVFGDALFFRRIESVAASQNSVAKKYAMLQKLAFISVIFKRMEFALQCLDEGRKLFLPQMEVHFKGLVYYRFLERLWEEAEKVPKIYPETFSERFNFDRSKYRFMSSEQRKKVAAGILPQTQQSNNYAVNEAESAQKNRFLKIKEYLKKRPYLYALSRKIQQRLIAYMKTYMAVREILRKPDIESLLKEFGLKELAAMLKKNRIEQAKFRKKTLLEGNWRS